jgi:glycosyltransferase involved in cell wall biosynthesis
MNKKTKICLNGMVGNESKTIRRMLESVAPYVDYWVIQCNGNDETEQIINDFFLKEKSIPGFTYKEKWDFPGWNRNHTLQVCLSTDHECDWILRMDADERLHVDEDFDWSVLEDNTIQSWNVTAQSYDTRYIRTWLWNSKLPWFFAEDKRHETIHLPEIGEGFQRVTLPYGFRHLVSQDGDTWNVPRKFLRDALELEIDNVVGYKVLDDTYHLWYIAKSYSDCYSNPNELPFGKKHSDEYARRAIWYFERFLNLMHDWDNSKTAKRVDEQSYLTLMFMAHAYKFIGDIDSSIKHYKLAGQFCPDRNEHYVYLIFLLNEIGRHEEILEITNVMLQPERTNPYPNLCFLVEDRAYYNTGTLIKELQESAKRKLEEHSIDTQSLHFRFE